MSCEPVGIGGPAGAAAAPTVVDALAAAAAAGLVEATPGVVVDPPVTVAAVGFDEPPEALTTRATVLAKPSCNTARRERRAPG